jgi:PTS system mannose-specific IIA component
MIGILLLTQGHIGKAMIEAAEHTLGSKVPKLSALTANGMESSDEFLQTFQQEMNGLDEGQGVLILADVYGASHTNLVQTFLKKDRLEMITGVNLPMLIRVLNYRNLVLEELTEKAFAGGSSGIVRAIIKPATNEN